MHDDNALAAALETVRQIRQGIATVDELDAVETLLVQARQPEPIVTDSGTRYEPWSDGYAVGYRCISPDGDVHYIYLNPSNDNPENDSTPDVFVYIGEMGDPSADRPTHYYEPFEKVPTKGAEA